MENHTTFSHEYDLALISKIARTIDEDECCGKLFWLNESYVSDLISTANTQLQKILRRTYEGVNKGENEKLAMKFAEFESFDPSNNQFTANKKSSIRIEP